jgi:hypothetical protein
VAGRPGPHARKFLFILVTGGGNYSRVRNVKAPVNTGAFWVFAPVKIGGKMTGHFCGQFLTTGGQGEAGKKQKSKAKAEIGKVESRDPGWG